MKDIVITILVAIVIILFFRTSTYIKNDPIVITQYDTVYQEKTFTKYRKGDSIPFLVLAVDTTTIHDTIKVLSDYMRIYAYSDTIRQDSNTFYIQDTITQNSIKGRQFKADLHEKTIFVTNNIYPKDKNELYLGFLADLRAFDNKVGLGVGVGFKTVKNGLFSLSASTNGYTLGYYKKF
jgi:hypothetical protein